MTRAELRLAFAKPNVKAFYMVVRKGESSLTDDAYTMVNKAAPDDPARGVFNHRFTSFAKHPYDGLLTTEGGFACGAAQFIPSTWRELANKYGFTGFTPPEQDEGYVGCLVKRGALDDVLAGRFETALAKCRLEWTSLPGAAENRNLNWTVASARSLYQSYGGSFDDGTQPAAPVEDRSTYVGGKTMDPLSLIAIFGPIISQLIPSIAKLFDRKAETPEKIAAATTAIDVFTKAAAGKVNASGTNAADIAVAVENARADPAVLQTATQRVLMEPSILSILEIGGGIAKAREYDLATMANDKPFWKTSAVFWISVMLVPLVYWFVGSVVIGGTDLSDIDNQYIKALFKLFGTAWNGESRSGIANLVIGLVLGGICGVYYGISVTQQRQSSVAGDNRG